MISNYWFDTYNNDYLSVYFYTGMGLYIFLNKIQDIRSGIIDQHKLIFKSVGFFFLFFWITESILFFDIGKYSKWVENANMFISGAFLIVSIFVILTFKNFTHDKKTMGGRVD